MRAGRSTMSAISTGYKRGIATIIDANVVTLITAFILFVLATAGVKGFAFTLGVGTLVSLFTAVLFTQAVLGTMGRSKLLRSPAMLGAGERHFSGTSTSWGRASYFFAMSGTILIIGVARGCDQGAQLRHRLRERHARDGQPRARRHRRGRARRDRAARPRATRRSRRSRTRSSATNVDPDPDGGAQAAAGCSGSSACSTQKFGVTREGFSSESVGPTFGEHGGAQRRRSRSSHRCC